MAKKKNPWRVRYGTGDGEIRFGDITADNELSAVQLRNFRHKEHYISLNETGKNWRKRSTTCRSTGSFQVKAGDQCDESQPGIYLDAVSGDVVIKSQTGKVRIEGMTGIELISNGPDNETGNIILDANEKVILAGQQISINGHTAVKVTSFGRTDIISKSTLNMYSTKIDIVDSVLVANPFKALMGVIKGTTTRHEAMMSLANADLISFL
tara:strand:- start:30 stop:659 length:630 start_codon:yes stop_codon:yes gene_type:complete